MIELGANMIGITGVFILVLAYALLSMGRVSVTDLRYHLMNFAGAVMHIISLAVFWNLPSFVIECFWIAISLYGMWQAHKRQKSA